MDAQFGLALATVLRSAPHRLCSSITCPRHANTPDAPDVHRFRPIARTRNGSVVCAPPSLLAVRCLPHANATLALTHPRAANATASPGVSRPQRREENLWPLSRFLTGDEKRPRPNQTHRGANGQELRRAVSVALQSRKPKALPDALECRDHAVPLSAPCCFGNAA